jgi:hypothetical protein
MNNVRAIVKELDMNSVQLMDCTSSTTIKLQRVNFFNRQLLTADDMNTERDYFLQKLRRHNRFMHGWGVVCGLSVTTAPTTATPWRVQIGSGYALGPYGDEIFVAEAVYFDLAACLSGGATNPCEPNMLLPGTAGTTATAYLGIKYAECLARPVQVANSGCGCDDDPCQYSRICDSFQLQCLPQLPDQPPPSQITLCNINSGTIASCPPCPTNPWVILATITLPALSSTAIAASNIDNTTNRPVIVSTAVLQAQVINCCCGGNNPPPPPSFSLSQILVRPSEPPTVGTIPWSAATNSATLSGQSSPQDFDFELVLTGAAPAGGFSVTVTPSYSAPVSGVTFSQPSPIVVPAGASSQQVLNNSVLFSAGNNIEATSITLTATAGENSPTATVTISAYVSPIQ